MLYWKNNADDCWGTSLTFNAVGSSGFFFFGGARFSSFL